MNDVKIKQQIVDKLKSSMNILVTVSNDPSVDALSAALGLTVMLNNLGKHATAVFSGATPPAITFLDPAKTFEATTDSLRDFIIALDKEKADHLRYKVEGDAVKIFITPYRTTITSDDLDFSQGDYNVEMVIALGVDDQSHLDGALESHGRILHDATVVTLTAGEQTSNLGSLDWHDPEASSLSEMLVGLVEGLSPEAEAPLLDQQTATALLTGIVAETDRFSNGKTSSKVMTVAAQLMAAGADQQLIATKLQESHEIASPPTNGSPTSSSAYGLGDTPTSSNEGFSISHAGQTLEEITNSVTVDKAPIQPPVEAPIESIAPSSPAGLSNAYALDPDPAAQPEIAPEPTSEPDTGSHAYLSDAPTYGATMNGASSDNEGPTADVFAAQPSAPAPNSAYALDPELGQPEPAPAPEPAAPVATVEPVEAPVIADTVALTSPAQDPAGELPNRDEVSRDDALAAVHATFDETPAAQPFSPAPGIVLPPPPPLPDFAALTPSPDSPYATLAQPERLGDIFAPDPSVAAPSPAPVTPPPAGNDNPAQFKIPGQ